MKRMFPFLTFLAFGCSDGTAPPGTAPPDIATLQLSVVAGDAQMAKVTERLPDAIVVVVRDAASTVVPGITVGFAVITDSGGQPFLPTVLSDNEGRAENFWDLGTLAGEHMMEVRAIVDGQPQALDTITARADPGSIADLGLCDDSEVCRFALFRGQQFDFLSFINATDAYGNAVSSPTLSYTLPLGMNRSGDTIWADVELEGDIVVSAGMLSDTARVAILYDLGENRWEATYSCSGNDGRVPTHPDSVAYTLTTDSVIYGDVLPHTGSRNTNKLLYMSGAVARTFSGGLVDTLAFDYAQWVIQFIGQLEYGGLPAEVAIGSSDGAVPPTYTGGKWICTNPEGTYYPGLTKTSDLILRPITP